MTENLHLHFEGDLSAVAHRDLGAEAFGVRVEIVLNDILHTSMESVTTSHLDLAGGDPWVSTWERAFARLGRHLAETGVIPSHSTIDVRTDDDPGA